MTCSIYVVFPSATTFFYVSVSDDYSSSESSSDSVLLSYCSFTVLLPASFVWLDSNGVAIDVLVSSLPFATISLELNTEVDASFKAVSFDTFEIDWV